MYNGHFVTRCTVRVMSELMNRESEFLLSVDDTAGDTRWPCSWLSQNLNSQGREEADNMAALRFLT